MGPEILRGARWGLAILRDPVTSTGPETDLAISTVPGRDREIPWAPGMVLLTATGMVLLTVPGMVQVTANQKEWDLEAPREWDLED